MPALHCKVYHRPSDMEAELGCAAVAESDASTVGLGSAFASAVAQVNSVDQCLNGETQQATGVPGLRISAPSLSCPHFQGLQLMMILTRPSDQEADCLHTFHS